VYFAGATAAGSAGGENEDWTATTSDLAVLLDGATSRTETGCVHGAAWYTRKLGANIIAEAASRSVPLDHALAAAIRAVTKLHPDCDLMHPGTPSAAAAIVRVEGPKLRYVVLGDATVVVELASGEIVTVTDQRISQTAPAERAEADRHLIGSPEKQTALVRMKYAELAARNSADGYWIAATDPAAVAHALHGTVDVASVRRLAILSDGAARAVDVFELLSWTDLLDLLEAAGPAELIKVVRRAEAQDPVGARHPRNKTSDDATVVFIDPNPHSGGQMRAISRDEHERLVQELLAEFQNNPNIMGGDLMFRDAEGRPCRSADSPYGVSTGAGNPAQPRTRGGQG
jgi:hypothetical protein